MDNTTMLVALGVIVVVAIAAVAIWQAQKSRRLQHRFGAEYERTVEDAGSRRRAEAELAAREKRVKAMEKGVEGARKALQGTTDEHLQKTWKLKARGQVVAEAPRYVMLQDSINHLAHHRGQLTVYLRLNEVPVPAIYGPSADDQRF